MLGMLYLGESPPAGAVLYAAPAPTAVHDSGGYAVPPRRAPIDEEELVALVLALT